MTMEIHLDFETASEVDLKAAGACAYAEHPSTEVLCLRYSIDGSPVHGWRPGEDLPRELFNAVEAGALMYAHNALFERVIWAMVCVARLGWPLVDRAQWRDTMARAAQMNLPLDLDRLGDVLDLQTRKDKRGKWLIQKLCKPQRVTKNNSDRWCRDPELLQEMYDYCGRDVEVEMAVHARIGDLPPNELAVWQLDQEINLRGVECDLTAVDAAIVTAMGTAEALEARCVELTGGIRSTQRDKLLGWLNEHGAFLEKLDKFAVEEALAGSTEDTVREVLLIRQQVSRSSVKKLEKMRQTVSAGNRLRGMLQYYGAGQTGRWAGRLVQPQNFPRPSVALQDVEPMDLIRVILSRDVELVRMIYGDPLDAIANALKPMFVASAGKKLVAADLSAIESVVLMMVAGQEDAIELLREDPGALYIDLAQVIFGHTVTKKEHPAKRTVGKIGTLGCGYQMGGAKLYDTGVKNKAPEELWTIDLAEATKTAYRERYDAVPQLWRGLEYAAIQTVLTGQPHEHRGIRYEMYDRWLTCVLPNSRRLFYTDPRVSEVELPWSTEEDPRYGLKLTYETIKDGQWKRVATYGGKLTENVVQAIARDILVEGMLRAEAAGFRIILTVHDEIVAEVDENSPLDHKVLEQCMTVVPSWFAGCPLRAEGWTDNRYRK